MEECMLTGNIGEWSETYVLLRILEAGKLFAADEKLQSIKGKYYPVLKVFRNERDINALSTNKIVFDLLENDGKVTVYRNNLRIAAIDRCKFGEESDYLYSVLVSRIKGEKNAFSVPRTQQFMQRIGCNVLKPSGQDKADISLLIHDINTSYELICDFSVKSYIGAMPTLLNASESTNFVYEVSNISDDQIEHFNGIESKEKIKDRMRYLNDIGARVNFIDLNQTVRGGETFKNNLMFIDTRMPEILGWFVKASYDKDIKDCKQLVRVLEQFNPLGYPLQLRGKIYGYKIKKVLSNIATSMIPAKPWNGKESANGGCIIVRRDGLVLTYYLYNRDMFEDYLLNNTKLERGSTSRHEYGSIYADGVRNFLKLNLQIRFNDRV